MIVIEIFIVDAVSDHLKGIFPLSARTEQYRCMHVQYKATINGTEMSTQKDHVSTNLSMELSIDELVKKSMEKKKFISPTLHWWCCRPSVRPSVDHTCGQWLKVYWPHNEKNLGCRTLSSVPRTLCLFNFWLSSSVRHPTSVKVIKKRPELVLAVYLSEIFDVFILPLFTSQTAKKKHSQQTVGRIFFTWRASF